MRLVTCYFAAILICSTHSRGKKYSRSAAFRWLYSQPIDIATFDHLSIESTCKVHVNLPMLELSYTGEAPLEHNIQQASYTQRIHLAILDEEKFPAFMLLALPVIDVDLALQCCAALQMSAAVGWAHAKLALQQGRALGSDASLAE